LQKKGFLRHGWSIWLIVDRYLAIFGKTNMKRFTCPNCSNEVHFQNSRCIQCGQRFGFDPANMQMRVASADNHLCRNAEIAGCNWLTPRGLCIACAHNHFVPDPSSGENTDRWAEIELAKRQLIYALLRWSLPHPTRAQSPDVGLAFDFLADHLHSDGSMTRVTTGHHYGLVTLNLAEGDELLRAEQRRAMSEPYRTVIGHLRHEIGHYYWAMLVQGPSLDTFRALFGDEREDYGQALQRHYKNGAPANWAQLHVSAYASSHPWEDFAETWAHWMHITDGLETLRAYGLGRSPQSGAVSVRMQEDPYESRDVQGMIDVWIPISVALNSMNRGMGQPDLYPFVLSSAVSEKMRFIHGLIQGAAENMPVQ
jgi:hypothetical protein